MQVTITVRPRGGARRISEHLAAAVRARLPVMLALAVAVAVVVVVAVVLAVALRGGPAATRARADRAQAAPCVIVMVSASNRAYAGVEAEHRAGCWRYHGEVRTRGLLAPDESR